MIKKKNKPVERALLFLSSATGAYPKVTQASTPLFVPSVQTFFFFEQV